MAEAPIGKKQKVVKMPFVCEFANFGCIVTKISHKALMKHQEVAHWTKCPICQLSYAIHYLQEHLQSSEHQRALPIVSSALSFLEVPSPAPMDQLFPAPPPPPQREAPVQPLIALCKP
jgi:hypothetical protein